MSDILVVLHVLKLALRPPYFFSKGQLFPDHVRAYKQKGIDLL